LSAESPGELTRLLREAREAGSDTVMPLVYDDLKRIARNQLARWRPGQTLNTTALVHEGYAKLAGSEELEWADRRHYFAVAARAMRMIVVDYARGLFAEKRSGVQVDIDLAQLPDDGPTRAEQVALVDQLLERLESLDPEMVRIVECRFYAGYTLAETADALGISQRTVQRKWDRARAWLVALGREPD
jgi:RNA polymerase sigma factor (TIGR02999 family)